MSTRNRNTKRSMVAVVLVLVAFTGLVWPCLCVAEDGAHSCCAPPPGFYAAPVSCCEEGVGNAPAWTFVDSHNLEAPAPALSLSEVRSPGVGHRLASPRPVATFPPLRI
jgi:hypothetical protein